METQTNIGRIIITSQVLRSGDLPVPDAVALISPTIADLTNGFF